MAGNAVRGAMAAVLGQAALGHAFTCEPSGSGAVYNGTGKYLGCYNDPSVSILSSAKLSSIAMTPNFCATYCGQRGFAYGGIEFGT